MRSRIGLQEVAHLLLKVKAGNQFLVSPAYRVCVCLWLTGLVKYHTGAKELLYVSAGPCLHDNAVTRNRKVFTLRLAMRIQADPQ